MQTSERFRRLTELLSYWQALWRPLAFQHRRLPWAADYPALYQALLALDDGAAACCEEDPFAAGVLADWLPVAELETLCRLPESPLEEAGGASLPHTFPNTWGDHIAGRKWRQLQAFVRCVPETPGPLLEWCAGKGHLARTLSRCYQREVVGLEWQPALCAQGQALARRQGVAVRLVEQDVLADDSARFLGPDHHAVALHACGDLHVALLQRATRQGFSLTVAPCCYQRTAATHYQPLSALGRRMAGSCGLTLRRADLALAVQETVTAPPAVSRQRERANAWRLGFDLLQRDVRGVDEYLPVPSLAYGKMPAVFAGFCRWAAEQKGLTLPPGILAQKDWEAAGDARLGRVKRLELVRHLFRRPLEVWLLLDRLLLLEEAGFDATLATFCSRDLTPRNAVLRATPARWRCD